MENVVQQVGVKFNIRNIVARKMYNTEFKTELKFSFLKIVLHYNKPLLLHRVQI